jgi:tetratricopeptide (TPR) repeat protein
MKEKQDPSEKNIVAVEEALSRSEQFIERNQNILIGAVVVIVLLIAGYIGYTRFILEPREREARAEMFMAERFFENEQYQLALEGDGGNLGFLDIISEYRMTRSANLARYYAGISALRLGDYEDAISQLKKFNKRDKIVGAMAYGAIGDAYLQLEDYSNAARYYSRAYKHESNPLTTPVFLMKAATVYEIKGDYGKAVDLYEKIHTDFPNSNEARSAERLMARARAARN